MNAERMNWEAKWPNPYVGPRPYRREEQDKMGGREKETGRLLNLLIADRIVLLHAPSGAGKTSLVQAGLIPRLEDDEDFWVSPPMRVGCEPEEEDWTGEGNRYIFSLLLSLEEAKLEAELEAEQLSEAELAALDLESYLAKHLPETAGDRDQVFIFDQFEEILTVDPFDEAGKVEFFSQVGQALRDRGRWALFIARDDYVARLEPFLLPIPSQLTNTFHLDLLRGLEALQAIRRPVERATFSGKDGQDPLSVQFQQEAAETLVDRLRQSTPYVEPVILQVVCLRLWEDLARDGRLDDGLIDLEDLEELVDVSEALSAYYGASVARTAAQTVANERQVRDWAEDKLINQQGVRTLVLLADEDQAIARELVDAHLVRVEERRGSAWAELAHDRLVDPVLPDNEAWRQENLSATQLQAELWAERGMPDELLFTGDALKEAQAWVEGYDGELTENDKNFMARSWAIQTRLDGERRRQRLFFGAIAIFGIIAIVLALIAFTLFGQSQANLELAETREAEAEANANLAAASEAEAKENLALAEKNAGLAATSEAEAKANVGLAAASEANAKANLTLAKEREAEAIVERDRANSRALAIAAQEAGEKGLGISLLLASEAGRTAETAAAYNTLRAAVTRLGIERLALPHEDAVNQASWNGEESLILTANGDSFSGKARVWDAASGEVILVLPHEEEVWQASWNGDDSLILTTSGDLLFSDSGTARVWDAVSGEEVFRRSGDGSAVNDAAWNSDETQIMIATEGGNVFRYFTQMDDLANVACNRIGHNMSLTEWQTYFQSEPYTCTCPDLPAHFTVLAAMDEGEINLAEDNQCAAE